MYKFASRSTCKQTQPTNKYTKEVQQSSITNNSTSGRQQQEEGTKATRQQSTWNCMVISIRVPHTICLV